MSNNIYYRAYFLAHKGSQRLT